MKIKFRPQLSILLLCTATAALADSPPIIINNNTAPPASSSQPSSTQNCQNQQQVDPNAQRPGTYYSKNPNGGTDTNYTTGDKTPYNADINCNNTTVPIQPYVYAPLPLPANP